MNSHEVQNLGELPENLKCQQLCIYYLYQYFRTLFYSTSAQNIDNMQVFEQPFKKAFISWYSPLCSILFKTYSTLRCQTT